MTDIETVIQRAIAEEALAMLMEGKTVSIEDFGALETTTYKAYEGRNPRTGEAVHVPAKKLPFWKFSTKLSDHFVGGAAQDFRFECPELVRRVAARLARSEMEIASALQSWLSGLVEQLGSTAEVEPLAHLGVVVIRRMGERRGRNPQTGEEIRIPGRAVVTFMPSKQTRARLNGEAAPALLGSEVVAKVLRGYPPQGLRSVADVRAVLARAGFERTTGTAAVDGDPDLLQEARAHIATARSWPLSSWLITDAAELGALRKEHLDFARQSGEDPVHVFAEEHLDGHWVFCEHSDPTGDRFVFLVGEDLESAHQHTMTFSGWLTARLLVAELEATAQGRVLSENDLTKVVSYLARIAPGVYGVSDLPY